MLLEVVDHQQAVGQDVDETRFPTRRAGGNRFCESRVVTCARDAFMLVLLPSGESCFQAATGTAKFVRAHAANFDGWRPLALQRELFDATYGPGSTAGPGAVAPPSADPRTPPPHLTGGTVDLTLCWQGRPLALGTGFDEFSALAATAAFEAEPGPVRTLRRLLYWTLRRHGFVVLAEEWWHFEFGTRLWSTITGHPVRYGPAAPAEGG